MRKASLLALTILVITVLSVNCSFQRNFASALDVSSPDCGFGFQNGSYIYFRDAISFESVEQIASTNTTYGDWIFFQETGSNERFGFYSTGVNVTVNNYFDNNLLELACVGAGSVKVQVCTKVAPVSVSGASGVFDSTNKIAIAAVTSSGTVQLNWNIVPGGGGGGGGDETPSPTVNPSYSPYPTPTGAPTGLTFKVDDLKLGKVASNTTIIVPLSFTYSGSNIYLQSISLPEPFNSWYSPNANFTSLVYLKTGTGVESAQVNIVFNVGNLTKSSYSGTFTVTALDAYGATHVSTGTISAGQQSQPTIHGWLERTLDWANDNPLLASALAFGVITVIVLAAFALSKKR